MEYNVENLFDTIHAEGKQDADFTPQGSHQWTSKRYWKKLGRLARTIEAGGGASPVDIVALVEVENDSVLTDLTQRTRLNRLGYKYVGTNSDDQRGINVALLYQPARFALIHADTLRISPLSPKLSPTRDVLHAAGRLPTGDTLDIFVCHMPSRFNGKPGDHYRQAIANRIKMAADSLTRNRQTPYIIITGDFNSWYPEKCLTKGLHVRLPYMGITPNELYILSHDMKAQERITGTYRYRREWNQLDNMVVNGRLLQDDKPNSIKTKPEHCRIGDMNFLLKRDKYNGELTPYRTYLGNYHQGGFSDHLPLFLDLFLHF